MTKWKFFLLPLIVVANIQCDSSQIVNDNVYGSITTGVLEIDFAMPRTTLPGNRIHRIELSVARTYDSLYRGLYVASANVMDSKTLYRFVLTPGDYYYQAGITCSCLGDSCLWGGFPGGRYGVRRTAGKVTIEPGKVAHDRPTFQ